MNSPYVYLEMSFYDVLLLSMLLMIQSYLFEREECGEHIDFH